MNKWARNGVVVGIVDDSYTQSYGMLHPVCYLEDYGFPPEVVENHAQLFINAEKMYLLIQELYLDGHCKTSGDILIEKLLGDMYVY